jgi:glycosyltransferase involved in cell wall biosynthesis
MTLNMRPDITIGIPLYNTEPYLRQCLETVTNQTLRNIEIIIVNDCSPDNSIALAREHQNIDSRIKIIEHEKNLGLGGARNTVIENASSDYIGFIDSDDWIDHSMFESLHSLITCENSDMAVCSYNLVMDEKVISRKLFVNGTIKKKEKTFFQQWLEDNTVINNTTWNKLFKKSLFTENNITFPEHIYHQDLATIPRVLHFCNKISFSDKVLYNWRQRNNSTTFSVSRKRINDNYTVFEIIKKFLMDENLFYDHEKDFYNLCFNSIKFNMNNIVRSDSDQSIKDEYVSIYLSKFLDMVPIDNIIKIYGHSSVIKAINLQSNLNIPTCFKYILKRVIKIWRHPISTMKLIVNSTFGIKNY